MSAPFYFLGFTLLALLIQGFFSMLEMACVSFNRVRLQYYVSKGSKRAKWLSKLLHNPTILFGTTLIGVNTAMQFGSELSRRFYLALNLNPDYAPITQIVIVLIFAELVPMFAARRFSEHVTWLGIPIIYFFSLILRPVIFFLGLICRCVNFILRLPAQKVSVITRDELQKAFEAREEKGQWGESEDLDMITTSIFSLKGQTAKDLMEPLNDHLRVNISETVSTIKKQIKKQTAATILVYEHNPISIVGVMYVRDLLRHKPNESIERSIKNPWFILGSTPVMEIIKQFRVNSQYLAIVLNEKGLPCGILTLEAIVDEIFSNANLESKPKTQIQVDRTYLGSTLIAKINDELNLNLVGDPGTTLEDLMEKLLGHKGAESEHIRLDHIELLVEEAPLIGEMTIRIRTVL